MTKWMFPLLVVSCEPVPAIVTGAEDLGDTDTDSTADGDADSAPFLWDGSRQFSFFFSNMCTDGVTEEGIEITGDPAYPQAVVCSVCDHIFEVDVTPQTLCSGKIKVITPTYRGIQWKGDKAMVVAISADNSGNWH
ncbi:MAG: hypothetical protein HN348_18075, partial [Proteobacteria bacterium]|nr:hypothetical protein [Pseudomonadota bacterium]